MNDNDAYFYNVRFISSPAHAGFPSPASDYEEQPLNLNDLVVQHSAATYFMRVAGESMIGACITSGDVIVVDRSVTASHNKIIVARLGEGFTLKRLQIVKPRRFFLKSEHPNFPVIEVTKRDDFEIFGVVTYCVHRLR
jgi:DNA polymerase V